MITFVEFIKESNFALESLSVQEISELDSMIGVINEDALEEDNSFEHGGKKYYAVFGKWYCDGKKISQSEYAKASDEYKKSFKKGTGKMYKDAETAEKGNKKQFANASVAKNEIVQRLKSFGTRKDVYGDDDDEGHKHFFHKEIEDVHKSHKRLIYRTKMVKAIKQYIKDPSSMSDADRKMVKDELKSSKNVKELLQHNQQRNGDG